jgi:hypothetical protein
MLYAWLKKKVPSRSTEKIPDLFLAFLDDLDQCFRSILAIAPWVVTDPPPEVLASILERKLCLPA